jgi:aryl-alcohol dehydrogenase-like predicted oxidoreductase
MAMDRVVIGKSDLAIAPLALGGNVFGWTASKEESFRILDAFVDGGGNHIDTADAYSAWYEGNTGGDSERIIGEWFRRSGRRDDVVIATKVGKLPGLQGLSAATIIRAAEDSLERLCTDVIDMYYAHADDPDTPLDETMAAFDSLITSGKVRWVAGSNYSATRLGESHDVAVAGGWSPFVALQQHYNLVHRAEYETGAAAVVEELGMVSLPYFALASGFLTGKYRSADDVVGARAPRVQGYVNDRDFATLDAVRTIADARGVEMGTVAIAWLRQQPTVAAPIASVSRLKQLPAMLASLSLDLSAEELAALDKASA